MTFEVERSAGVRRVLLCLWGRRKTCAAEALWFRGSCPPHCAPLTMRHCFLGPSPRLSVAALQPLRSADSHWHHVSWGDYTRGCARARSSQLVDSDAKTQKCLLSGFPSGESFVIRVGYRRRTKFGANHGCAYCARDGGPGGVGQPAHLEPGASDPEEVVQPWPDAVPTLTRSLVQDGEVLPGNDSSVDAFCKKRRSFK